MKFVRMLGAMVIALAVSVGVAHAQAKKLTPDEVKALTIKAADFIAAKGLEEAEKAFTTPDSDFKFGEIYVNVIDFNGNWVIYPPKPENKGKNVLNFIDEDGKKLGEEILNTGKKGEGWTEYRWKNPATNTIQPKVTYVKKVPGKDYVAYIGIYK
ncbi:MAG: cache domain-containing protein [Magnetospirillum sp.]|nr:cache domain-containing protein [Magnetospirillum sp.]